MINVIHNANVYLDGQRLAGKLDELVLPVLKSKMHKVTALGIYGEIEVPVGMEAMEAKLTWNSIYAEHWAKIQPHRPVSLMIKSNMETIQPGGMQTPAAVTVLLTGTFKEFPFGTIKPGERISGLETPIAVHFFQISIDGVPVKTVDILTNTYTSGAEDVLLPLKTNQ